MIPMTVPNPLASGWLGRTPYTHAMHRHLPTLVVLTLLTILPACAGSGSGRNEEPTVQNTPTQAPTETAERPTAEPPAPTAPTPAPADDDWLANRPDWADDLRPTHFPVHPAERFLRGMHLVLDPGHGGRGVELPTYRAAASGLREADANLRVAQALRELLEAAGAQVTLTRESEFSDAADDRLPDTGQRRADIANQLPRDDGQTGADLLLSIHHNASSNPDRNFTTVWFHGQPHWHGPELDLARGISLHLARELQTQAGLTSPVMSDLQAESTGFDILRHADVPALLLEISFYTHPREAQRLADLQHNRRAAYAIYLALCEWAYGGSPTQTAPTVRVEQDHLIIETTLDDGLPADWWGADQLRLLPDTIALDLNGRRLPHLFDPQTQQVRAVYPLNRTPPGPIELAISFQNLSKHGNSPRRYGFSLTQENDNWVVTSPQPMGRQRAAGHQGD